MGETKNKSNRYLPAVCAVLVLLLAVSGLDYFYYRGRIYPGVSLGGVPLDGLTVEQAAARFDQWLNEEGLVSEPLFFHFDGQIWSFGWHELGVIPDTAASAAEAYGIARDRLHVLNYPSRFRLLWQNTCLTLRFTVKGENFDVALAALAEHVRREPVDARFELAENNTTVVIVPETPGRVVDRDRTLAGLTSVLERFPVLSPVEIAVAEVAPEVTAADLDKLGVRYLVTSSATAVSSSIRNRVHNIRLAAAALDNILIRPGEEFSFNRVVGKTDAEKGYRPAPVIINRELVDGTGGGVCQVSSTLYNAALLAELSVLERANHSLTVAYLPPGLDATISYGWRDLRFLNDRPHAVWLRTFFDGASLIINMYGDPVPDREVKVITTDRRVIRQDRIYKDSDELPAGEIRLAKEGQPGYRVTVWRVVYQDGKEVGRELISRDAYHPVPDEYLRGTASD